MKIKQKMERMFGNLITAAFEAWGAARAEKMVRVAINARWVVFQEQPDYETSSAKGRFLLIR